MTAFVPYVMCHYLVPGDAQFSTVSIHLTNSWVRLPDSFKDLTHGNTQVEVVAPPISEVQRRSATYFDRSESSGQSTTRVSTSTKTLSQ